MIGTRSGRRCWSGLVWCDRLDRAGPGAAPRRGWSRRWSAPRRKAFPEKLHGASICSGRVEPNKHARKVAAMDVPLLPGFLQSVEGGSADGSHKRCSGCSVLLLARSRLWGNGTRGRRVNPSR